MLRPSIGDLGVIALALTYGINASDRARIISLALWVPMRSTFYVRASAALVMGFVSPLAHAESAPRILTNGIVNTAGAPLPPAPVAPGSVISIYGSNFNSSSGTHAGGVSR